MSQLAGDSGKRFEVASIGGCCSFRPLTENPQCFLGRLQHYGGHSGHPAQETFHNIGFANEHCRRQVEKSPLAQIEMSLSPILDGVFWADDGDCDEPDGDRPDERIAGSGCKQDQSNGSRGVDGTWAASGVSAGEGLRPAWPTGVGVTTAWQAQQPLLFDGFACRSDWHPQGALLGLWPDPGSREACGAS